MDVKNSASICYLGEELPGLHSATKIHILFQFANHLACFRAGDSLSPSLNSLRLIAKMLAVHKNAVFMDRVCKNQLLSTIRAVFVDGR